jgi:hypothetical protein
MYEDFNNLATNFLLRMQKTFPKENKIKKYLHNFEVLQVLNSKKPVEMFMENIQPFGEQILSKNEIFFKKDEFVNSAENISGKLGLIQYWDTMEQETKDAIWEYIQGLYILGMGSLGKQKELQELIAKTGFNG